MSGNNNTSQDLNNMDQVNKAIAMLAIRVGKLETDAPAMEAAEGDGSNLAPVLAAMLGSLKELRTSLLTASSEADGKFKELDKFKEENAKLKYQIIHLKRSLEDEESKKSS